MDIREQLHQLMHTFIPDAGGMTWGDLVVMGALTLLGWASELCRYLVEKNGSYY